MTLVCRSTENEHAASAQLLLVPGVVNSGDLGRLNTVV